MEDEWSPEQIAAYLRTVYSDQPSWHVCHETIYQALYHGGKGGLSRTLTAKLRTGRPLRRHRRRADVRRRAVMPTLNGPLGCRRPAPATHRPPNSHRNGRRGHTMRQQLLAGLVEPQAHEVLQHLAPVGRHP